MFINQLYEKSAHILITYIYILMINFDYMKDIDQIIYKFNKMNNLLHFKVYIINCFSENILVDIGRKFCIHRQTVAATEVLE